jgi:hypothetical protein
MSFRVFVPRQVTIPLSDGRELRFPDRGSYDVDDEHGDHPILSRFKSDGDTVVVAVPSLIPAGNTGNIPALSDRPSDFVAPPLPAAEPAKIVAGAGPAQMAFDPNMDRQKAVDERLAAEKAAAEADDKKPAAKKD